MMTQRSKRRTNSNISSKPWQKESGLCSFLLMVPGWQVANMQHSYWIIPPWKYKTVVENLCETSWCWPI
jgi:hypothetical protein